MIENKFKTIILCLYGVAGFHFLSAFWVISASLSAMKELNGISGGSIGMSILMQSGFWFAGNIIPVLMGCYSIFVAKELIAKKSWAWIGAMFAFAFGVFSFAIPLCILGLICLFHESVRKEYLDKQLEEIFITRS